MSQVPRRVVVAWIAGLALVVGGVLVKRVLAPSFTDRHDQAWTAVAGIGCATIGLGVIAVGISIRNRVARERRAQGAGR